MPMPQIQNDLHRQMIALTTLRACINCKHFTSTDEAEPPGLCICALAGIFPPAEVIVYGCPQWLDYYHDVPF